MESPLLRPLTMSEIIRETFRLYGETLSTTVSLALIAHAPLLLLTNMVAESAKNPGGAPDNPVLALLLLGLVLVLTGVVVHAMYLALISAAVGRPAGIAQCLGQSRNRTVVAVMFGYMLTNALSHVGLFILVVPGLVLGGMFAATVPVIMIERLGVFAAMGRAVRLLQQNWMKGIGVFAFATFISELLPLQFLWALQALVGYGPFSPVLAALLAAITMPLAIAAHLLLYFSLRADPLNDGSGTALRVDLQKLIPVE